MILQNRQMNEWGGKNQDARHEVIPHRKHGLYSGYGGETHARHLHMPQGVRQAHAPGLGSVGAGPV